jgi:hypothetical protein
MTDVFLIVLTSTLISEWLRLNMTAAEIILSIDSVHAKVLGKQNECILHARSLVVAVNTLAPAYLELDALYDNDHRAFEFFNMFTDSLQLINHLQGFDIPIQHVNDVYPDISALFVDYKKHIDEYRHLVEDLNIHTNAFQLHLTAKRR